MIEDEKQKLLYAMNEIHTTDLGAKRIRKNLTLSNEDVVAWCIKAIMDVESVCIRKGKNYYVQYKDVCITIHAKRYTIITAHRQKHTSND